MRLQINGSWSVESFTELLTQLEQAYFAAAALEALAEPRTIGDSSIAGSRQRSAEEILHAVASRLGGGLQIRSIHYSSPGFLELIGAISPLKTLKDGIIENRKINSDRAESRQLDERERQRQSSEHVQAMEKESRLAEEARLAHAQKMAGLQIEADKAQGELLVKLLDRLPPDERTTATTTYLVQMFTRNIEGIATETKVEEVKLLELSGQAEIVGTEAGSGET